MTTGSGTEERMVPLPPMRARSRLALRAELLPALSVLATVCLLGLPLGWLWSRLAPAERGVLLGDGGFAPLPGESAHRFDALAVFVLLGLGVGVVTGTAAWLLRRHRGPVVLLAVVAGTSLAGIVGGIIAIPTVAVLDVLIRDVVFPLRRRAEAKRHGESVEEAPAP